MEEANLISMEASLLRDLGQFEQSAAVLNRAVEIYREEQDGNLWAKTLIQQANAIGYVEPAEAIRLLQNALALLDASEEPRLELCARHNLIWFLNDDGKHQEALTLLELSRPFYRVFADSWTQLRLHWIEARIARALGDLEEAEATFRKIWYAFDEKDFHYELTLVSIDLVEVYSARGKFREVVKLVREFLPVLESWGMHTEGPAFWMLFRDSVIDHASMQATLDTAAFRAVALYYHRAWRHPLDQANAERGS